MWGTEAGPTLLPLASSVLRVAAKFGRPVSLRESRHQFDLALQENLAKECECVVFAFETSRCATLNISFNVRGGKKSHLKITVQVKNKMLIFKGPMLRNIYLTNVV